MTRTRICSFPECKTLLSDYNSADTCYVHTAKFQDPGRAGADRKGSEARKMSDRFIDGIPGAYPYPRSITNDELAESKGNRDARQKDV